MLSASRDTLLKLSKTTSPKKLFAYDCATLYVTFRLMISIILTLTKLSPEIFGNGGNKYRKSQAKKSFRAGIGFPVVNSANRYTVIQLKYAFFFLASRLKKALNPNRTNSLYNKWCLKITVSGYHGRYYRTSFKFCHIH